MQPFLGSFLVQKPSLTLKCRVNFFSFSILSRFGCLAQHSPRPPPPPHLDAKHPGLISGARSSQRMEICEHVGWTAATPHWAIQAKKETAPLTVLGGFRKVWVFSSGILQTWLQMLRF